MNALKITLQLLVLFICKYTSAKEVPPNAFTLAKCLDVSSNLADSLKHALLGLKVGKIETPVGKDCLDLLEKGVKDNGVYNIFPGGKEMQVYCDMKTDGGGWTVFQRRVNALVDFYRGWKDYKAGFGDMEENFWLGLENIHKLTSFTSDTSSLRVDMWIPKEYRYEMYANFYVGDGVSGYKLSIANASGTAGDSFASYHNNRKFSTRDKDQDGWSDNCARKFKGAWWYNDCHRSNLNGQYLNGAHKQFAIGINWKPWKGHYYSLQKVEMKVRRNK